MARERPRHGVTDAAANAPGDRKPHLVGQHHQLARGAYLGAVLARAAVADIHADYALDELRVAQGELVAEEAAPVVQEERHAPARAGLLDDAADGAEHLVERVGAPRAEVEAREREADASVAALQGFGLPVPQGVGIGPAMDHDDRRGTDAFHDHVHATLMIATPSVRSAMPPSSSRDSRSRKSRRDTA